MESRKKQSNPTVNARKLGHARKTYFPQTLKQVTELSKWLFCFLSTYNILTSKPVPVLGAASS